MISTRFVVPGCLLLIAAVAQAMPHAQEATLPTEQVPSLQEFFQNLTEHYSRASLPPHGQLRRVTNQIATAHPEDISRALPSVFRALGHHDDNVKLYAGSALLDISRRPDGGKLLAQYIPVIGRLLDEPNHRLQAVPPTVFLWLGRGHEPEMLSVMLPFLNRIDRAPQAQLASFYALARIAPDNPEVIDSLGLFMSRPLTRIATLNALQGSGVRHPKIVTGVIRMLELPDQTVKLAAIETLRGNGKRGPYTGGAEAERAVRKARRTRRCERRGAKGYRGDR
jgi:hypothetical protein